MDSPKQEAHGFKFCKSGQVSFYLRTNSPTVPCFAAVLALLSLCQSCFAPRLRSLHLGLSVVFCCRWNITAAYLLSSFSSLSHNSSEKHPLLLSVCSLFPGCVLFLSPLTQDRRTVVVVNYSRELQGSAAPLWGVEK